MKNIGNKKLLKDTVVSGLLTQNPTFVLVLGMCPTIAMSSTLVQAVSMGIATTFVLIFSNLFISLLRNIIPEKIRIPCYITVLATFSVIVEMVMRKWFPELYSSMKAFIALIVVNCIILGRAESFASKNTPLISAVDGLSMGLGFTLSLSILAIIREPLSYGTLFGVSLFGEGFPEMSAGAIVSVGFIVLGCTMAAVNFIRAKIEQKRKLALGERGTNQ